MEQYEEIVADLRSSCVTTHPWESLFPEEAHEFFVFSESRNGWPEIGGLVVLAYQHMPGKVSPIHIGMTKNFDSYLSGSPEVRGARERGITHIHLFPLEDQEGRVSLRGKLKEANPYR